MVAAGVSNPHLVGANALAAALADLKNQIEAEGVSEAKRYALRRQMLRLRAQHKRLAAEEAEVQRNEEEVRAAPDSPPH